jgi:WD40 repeat protein
MGASNFKSGSGPAFPADFGDYEIEGEINRGGMGVVYRARQKSLGRQVALKLILTGRFAADSEVRRFHREASLAARLDHPNIIPVYEVGFADGTPFFSMKLIDGPSLASPGALKAADEIATPGSAGREAQREVARFVAKVARAVNHAHQRALLHRDLKPGNILIDRDGQPWVTDFGLTMLMDAQATQARSTVLFGTPAYMAPEQLIDGGQITVAADVYSLGAILYELLTRHPPFEAATPIEILMQARDKDPRRPESWTPLLDRDLSTICLKCLRRKPEDRYASMMALADDLERFADGRAIRARRVGVVERVMKEARRRPGVTALLMLLAGSLTAVVVGSVVFAAKLNKANQEANRQLRAAKIEAARNTRLLGTMFRGASVLPDLKEAWVSRNGVDVINEEIAQLAQTDFVWDGAPESRDGDEPVVLDADFHLEARCTRSNSVVVIDRSTGESRWEWRNPTTNKLESLVISPDGRRLVIITDANVSTLVDVAGRREIATYPRMETATFSFDGANLLLGNYNRHFQLVDPETGAPIATKRWPTPGPDDVLPGPAGREEALLVSARQLVLWNWRTGQYQTNNYSTGSPPSANHWNGDYLAVGDEAGTVSVFAMEDQNGSKPIEFTVCRGKVENVWISADGGSLYTYGDGEFSFWDTASKSRIAVRQMNRPLAVSPDRRLVATLSPGRWQAARAAPGVIVSSLKFETGTDPAVRDLIFNESGSRLAVVQQDGLHLVATPRFETEEFLPLFGAQGVVFLKGGDRLLLTGRRELLWAALEADGHWRRRRIDPIQPERFFGPPSADGRGVVALPDLGRSLVLLDAETGKVREERQVEGISSAALGPSGRWLAYSVFLEPESPLNGVHLLDRRSGKEVGFFKCRVRMVLFSPDEKSVIGADTDKLFAFGIEGAHAHSVWETRIPAGFAKPAAWTSDMAWIARTAVDGSSQLVSLADPSNSIALIPPLPGRPAVFAFSPDAGRLAVGTVEGRVELWDFAATRSALEGQGIRWPLPGSASQSGDGPAGEWTFRSALASRIPNRTERPPVLRSEAATPDQLDLSAHYWKSLNSEMAGTMAREVDLREFDPGLRIFNGIPFDSRGIVVLPGGEMDRNQPHSGVSRDPIALRVGRTARRIHFLGNLWWAYPHLQNGTVVASALVRFRGGMSERIEFRKGVEFGDWFENVLEPRPVSSTGSKTVWTGLAPAPEGGMSRIRINDFAWESPHPDVSIDEIILKSADEAPSLFLLGITLER